MAFAFFLYSWLSKLVTFALNQLLYRHVSPATLGLANVTCDLYLNLLLQLTREGVRIAFLRLQTHQTGNDVRNATFLPWLFALFTFPVVSALFLSFYDRDQLGLSFLLYALAAAIELATEPIALIQLQARNITSRLRIEGVALLVRSIVLFTLAFQFRPDLPLSVWGWAQISYALTVSFAYLYIGPWHWPTLGAGLHRDTTSILWSIQVQTVIKLIINEGDKLLVAFFVTSERVQGVYALVMNYGSLMVRLVFLPVEEALRHLIPRLHEKKSKQSAANVARLYRVVIKTYALLSILLMTFGPLYAKTIMRLLLGRMWSEETEAPEMLALLCYVLPLIGLNGTTEAFWQSLAPPDAFRRWSRDLIWLFALYAILTGLLFQSAVFSTSAGLMLSLALNAGIRSVYSTYQLHIHLKQTYNVHLSDQSLRSHLPLYVALALISRRLLTPFTTSFDETRVLLSLLIGCLCGCVFLATMCFLEKSMLATWRDLSTKKKVT